MPAAAQAAPHDYRNNPLVVIELPQVPGQSSVTLHGSVNPHGQEVVRCQFEYGITTRYGRAVACMQSVGSGTSPVAVSAFVTDLSANTTYHYRLAVTTPSGDGFGIDQEFTTAPVARYYTDGLLLGSEPLQLISWGTLALKTTKGGSGEVVCRIVAADTVANQEGGVASTGSTQVFAPYECAGTACPSTSVVSARSLPWPTVLERIEGGAIVLSEEGTKLAVECQSAGNTESSTTFVGTTTPTFRNGTSALHPPSTEFGSGSGLLEAEGSAGGVLDQLQGKLKLLGAEEQELVSSG